MKKLLLIVLAAGITVVGARAASGTLVVNGPADGDTGNCYPFGCAYNGEYQQVYASGQFTGVGTITITKLLFYNTQSSQNATSMNSGAWTISLSTTAATVSTLLPTFASNVGTDNKQVFSGNLSQSWVFGNTLTITLTTPFTYDPSKGNLLMDVTAAGTSAPGGNIYFDQRTGSGSGIVTTRDYCTTGSGCLTGTVDTGRGLVTGFVYGSSAAPVPAASTLSLVLMGLGLSLMVAYQIRQWKAVDNHRS